VNLRGITAELIAPETANENPVRHIDEGCLRAEAPLAKGVATQSLSSMTEVLSCPLVSGQMARRRTLVGSGQSPEVGDSFQFVDVNTAPSRVLRDLRYWYAHTESTYVGKHSW
jgi:hypothetical protein